MALLEQLKKAHAQLDWQVRRSAQEGNYQDTNADFRELLEKAIVTMEEYERFKMQMVFKTNRLLAPMYDVRTDTLVGGRCV